MNRLFGVVGVLALVLVTSCSATGSTFPERGRILSQISPGVELARAREFLDHEGVRYVVTERPNFKSSMGSFDPYPSERTQLRLVFFKQELQRGEAVTPGTRFLVDVDETGTIASVSILASYVGP